MEAEIRSRKSGLSRRVRCSVNARRHCCFARRHDGGVVVVVGVVAGVGRHMAAVAVEGQLSLKPFRTNTTESLSTGPVLVQFHVLPGHDGKQVLTLPRVSGRATRVRNAPRSRHAAVEGWNVEHFWGGGRRKKLTKS